MSESSDGGDGGGSAGTTPKCIHCEKELPGPACKICSSCGKPAQETQVDKADESYVAHCFKCETRLFSPNAKFCHDSGAEQPTSKFSIYVGSTASPEHGTLVDKTGNDSTTSVSTGQGEAQNDSSGLPADQRKRKRSRDENGSERATEPEHAKLPKTEGNFGVQDPLSTAADHPLQENGSSSQKAGGSSEPQKDGHSKKSEPQPQNPPSPAESPRVPGSPPSYADATKGQVCLYFHPAVLNYLEMLWVHEYCIL